MASIDSVNVTMRCDTWTPGFLDGMRLTGDPLADDTVAQVFKDGGVSEINALWRILLHNDQILPEGLNPAVIKYFENSTKLGEAIDFGRVRKGESVFCQHGILSLTSLLCASLPECYVMSKGSQVLATTQRLEKHVYRRLLETAQMLVAVMTPGGLEPSGGGIRAAQKVRLMHAAVRHLILQKPPEPRPPEPPKDFADVLLAVSWDISELGYPINQEDMAYTLLTFSYVIPRSLKKFGVKLSDEDADAYIYCWNVVGTIMGVHPDLMAHNMQEAAFLFSRIKSRQEGATEDGRKMTAALEQCIQHAISSFSNGLMPKTVAQSIPKLIMREMLDATTVQILNLQALSAGENLSWRTMRVLLSIGEALHSTVLQTMGNKFGIILIHWLTQMPRGWDRQLFDLPETLRKTWRINGKKTPSPAAPAPANPA